MTVYSQFRVFSTKYAMLQLKTVRKRKELGFIPWHSQTGLLPVCTLGSGNHIDLR